MVPIQQSRLSLLSRRWLARRKQGLDLSNPQNWPQVSFNIRVFAYSKIGNGAVFNVDWGTKSFTYVSGEDAKQSDGTGSMTDDASSKSDDDSFKSYDDAFHSEDQASLSDDDASWSDDDDSSWCTEQSVEFRENWHALVEARSDSDDDSDSDLDLDECSSSDLDSVAESAGDNRAFEPPPQEVYASVNTFTGVNILAHQRFGRILSKAEKARTLRKNDSDGGNDIDGGGKKESIAAGGHRSVLARGIVIAADLINRGDIDIRDSKDEHMEVYDLVDGWKDIPEEVLLRPVGWARRPSRDEGMYGPTYATGKVLDLISECVRKGNENSSEKMGPAQVQEVIEEKFPGLYCLPHDTEIAKVISSLVQKEKDKKKGKKTATRESKVPQEIVHKIRELIKSFPTETGKSIETRLSTFNGTRRPSGYNRKAIMQKVNGLRATAKKKKQAQRKRRLIG